MLLSVKWLREPVINNLFVLMGVLKNKTKTYTYSQGFGKLDLIAIHIDSMTLDSTSDL